MNTHKCKILIAVIHLLNYYCTYISHSFHHQLKNTKTFIYLYFYNNKNNALCIIYEISFHCNNLQHLLVNKTLLFHINVAYSQFRSNAKSVVYIPLPVSRTSTNFMMLRKIIYIYLRKTVANIL